jgi:hypothetical protein
MDEIVNKLRAILATKQLEVDTLKRRLREKDDIINANNTRQRSDTSREKTKRTSKGSDSNK